MPNSAMQRIEQLVRELESADPRARSAAQELMTAVMEMHGEALSVIVEGIGPYATRRLSAEDSVRNVLLLYDLHPDDVATRVRAALDTVRPYIRSHGGNVELARIEDGVVHLKLDGSCGGCPSSARTVKSAIEGAIFAAAPEVQEVVAEGASSGAAVAERWQVVPDVAAIADGGGRTIVVAGRALFFCRAGESVYAWADSCAACGHALEGSTIDAGSLRCSACGCRFELRAAGKANDDPSLRLEPFPLLVEDGQARVAIA